MKRVYKQLRFSPILFMILVLIPGISDRTAGAFNPALPRIIEHNEDHVLNEKPVWQIATTSDEWEYITQSGDTLEVIAARFQVSIEDIDLEPDVPPGALLDPGLKLIIQRPGPVSGAIKQLLPDTEVVYSASAADFSSLDYAFEAGGFLSSYQEYLRSTGWTPAGEIIERVAIENSINPRLLMALLEYRCGCLTGPLSEDVDANNLMRLEDPFRRGLYRQLGWTVNQISLGYYGWRRGLIQSLYLQDGNVVPLDPGTNAGSAAVGYLFSALEGSEEWSRALGDQQEFPHLHRELFPEVWLQPDDAKELFPSGLIQPDLILPFEVDQEWSFTSGPHPAWETEADNAALDFAPASEHFGCELSQEWVLAAADGLVVRSRHNALVLDLDGDGEEGTGWNLIYMHLADFQRTPEGNRVIRGEPIGHPSCEGGPADGTHVHLARKYNGEWIAAGGPLPFMMSGWVAQEGFRPYAGILTRKGQIVVANPLSPATAFISRSSEDARREARISRNLWWEE
jgi:murein DD-endopeptidase MepM/ murein hydrolase activator NlpD